MPFDFACPDWAEKLARGETPIPPLPLDAKAAEQAVGVLGRLRLPDVPGQPPFSETFGEWIFDIARAIFGSVQDGARQVGEVFVLVPKKNGKTTGAAALALTFMLLNTRPRSDMLIIGPTQKISDVAFQQAAGIIAADEYLSKRFHVREHRNEILDRVNKSRLMVRTFGTEVLTGSKPIFCLIDEVHELGRMPYAADVIRQVRGGQQPFADAVLVMITTQSDHPPQGVFKSELQYARGVRDGRITEGVRLLPVLYEFPEAVQTADGQPWRDPANWHMVNPQMGRQLSLDRMVGALQRAEEDGAGEIIAWATQHLNVEVGLALHSNRWRGADFWQGAAETGLDLESLLERCEVVTCGIDIGGSDDLTALAVMGRETGTRRWLHWAHAWVDRKVLGVRKEIAHRLEEFEALGQLSFVEATVEEIEQLTGVLQTIDASGLFPEKLAVGCDSWGISSFLDHFAAVGLDDELMTNIKQGAYLADAVYDLERRLRDGTVRHGGQEIMAFAIQNAITVPRGNRVIITKETAGKCKIDPLIATFNAVMLMQLNPEAAGTRISPWEDPNFRIAVA